MKLVDLTCRIEREQNGRETARLEKVHVERKKIRYTATRYFFDHDSMVGTYLDLPGHILDTDDGQDAAGYPLEKLYRLDAAVIHLDRAGGSGRISADDLARACPGGVCGGALVVNALGKLRFDEIEFRSVYLGADAVAWIVESGACLLVSDVFESDTDAESQRVFLDLFAAGVSTVCQAVNLDKLTSPKVKLTVLPLKFHAVTQLPCRVLAEMD